MGEQHVGLEEAGVDSPGGVRTPFALQTQQAHKAGTGLPGRETEVQGGKVLAKSTQWSCLTDLRKLQSAMWL